MAGYRMKRLNGSIAIRYGRVSQEARWHSRSRSAPRRETDTAKGTSQRECRGGFSESRRSRSDSRPSSDHGLSGTTARKIHDRDVVQRDVVQHFVRTKLQAQILDGGGTHDAIRKRPESLPRASRRSPRTARGARTRPGSQETLRSEAPAD